MADPTIATATSTSSFDVGTKFPKKNIVTYTIGQVFNMMQRQQINLDPPYQRAEVSSKKAQSKSLLSIYRGIALPAIQIATTAGVMTASGEQVMNVLDGKQPLTIIKQFLIGECYVNDIGGKVKFWVRHHGKEHRGAQVLNAAEIEEFKAKKLVFIIYETDLTIVQQREIFLTLQKDKPLHEGERLWAADNYWVGYAKVNMEKYEAVLSTSKVKSKKDFSNFIGLMVIICDCMESQGTDEPYEFDLDRKATYLSDEMSSREERGPREYFEEGFEAVMDKYLLLVVAHGAFFKEREGYTGTSLSPVEMFAIAAILFFHYDDGDRVNLLRIWNMRTAMFTDHKSGRRANAHCWETVTPYLEGHVFDDGVVEAFFAAEVVELDLVEGDSENQGTRQVSAGNDQVDFETMMAGLPGAMNGEQGMDVGESMEGMDEDEIEGEEAESSGDEVTEGVDVEGEEAESSGDEAMEGTEE